MQGEHHRPQQHESHSPHLSRSLLEHDRLPDDPEYLTRQFGAQASPVCPRSTASLVYLELADDFQNRLGPDLFGLLHNEALPSSYDANNYFNLGGLEKFRGAQRYQIPANADLSAFESVVIWCRHFNVTFGCDPLASGKKV